VYTMTPTHVSDPGRAESAISSVLRLHWLFERVAQPARMLILYPRSVLSPDQVGSYPVLDDCKCAKFTSRFGSIGHCSSGVSMLTCGAFVNIRV